jgi:NitT/TauT family transport system substrate-binding protein
MGGTTVSRRARGWAGRRPELAPAGAPAAYAAGTAGLHPDEPMGGAAERPHVRRRFLRGVAGLGLAAAGGSLLAGCEIRDRAAGPGGPEPPPETTRIRLARAGTTPIGSCQAPHYLAAEFLPAEGFTDVSYTQIPGGTLATKAVAAGEADLAINFTGPLITRLDAGDQLVILAGAHAGCLELFGTERVRTIRDLKGKTTAVTELGGAGHVFLSSMAAYVGLDPRKDITWLTRPPAEAIGLLADGQIDAYLASPPYAQELRARKVGHVVVNSTMDRPWSQYFCCLEYANVDFVRKHPVATKRALRAVLRAAEFCAREPERAARLLVDTGVTGNYGYTLEALSHMPYGKWRDFDPEDTLRFYALRLQEAGMIESSPQKIIAQGTDWRFLKELKQEAPGSPARVGTSDPPQAAAFLCRLEPAVSV